MRCGLQDRRGGGEREEDVVERRLAAVDVDRVDPGGVERAHDLDQSRARPGRDRDLPLVGILARGPVSELRERPGRGREIAGVLDGDDDALAADARLELGRGAGRRDAPVVEHHDLVGEAVGLLEVLGREHDGGAVADELAEQLPQVVAALRIEPGRRLVEEQHRRRGDEARGEIEPPAHAARERAHEPVGHVVEPELLEQLVGASAGHRARQVVQAPDQLAGSRAPSAGRRRWRSDRSGRCARAPGRVGDHGRSRRRARCPIVGSASVVRMRIAVVLPAPLWPSRPRTLPAAAWKLDVVEGARRRRSACRDRRRRRRESATDSYSYVSSRTTYD